MQLHGGNTLPMTGSHEGVGVIEKLGSEVDAEKFHVGDRVGTLNYYHPCGTSLLFGSDGWGLSGLFGG
jgi:D-arabinose 1-dehydrogenase-like Zn-dependent alcohol dehydrogenase